MSVKVFSKIICFAVFAAGFCAGQVFEVPPVRRSPKLQPLTTSRGGRTQAAMSARRTFISDAPLHSIVPVADSVRRFIDGNRVIGRTYSVAAMSLAGSWDYASDGARAWRIRIRAPGAAMLRVHFTSFDVGAGTVALYSDSGGSDNRGMQAYAGTGVFSDGDFWSGLVSGDTVIVEFVPEGNERPDRLPFRIAQVATLDNPLRADSPGFRALPAQRDSETVRLKESDGDSPLACEIDVHCSPDSWLQTAQSLGMLLVIKDDYVIGCSGTLLNNAKQNFRPYFLTANHCVADQESARSSIVLWHAETNSCNGDLPDLAALSYNWVDRLLLTLPIESGDFTLLLLYGDLPEDSVYAGWTTRETPMGGFVTSIHHPHSSWKRIAAGNRVDDEDVQVVDGDGNVIATAPGPAYYRINWAIGTTEPGSSGAPLFNEQSLVVGVLSHGNVSCRGGTDGYGRLDLMFPELYRYLMDDEL